MELADHRQLLLQKPQHGMHATHISALARGEVMEIDVLAPSKQVGYASRVRTMQGLPSEDIFRNTSSVQEQPAFDPRMILQEMGGGGEAAMAIDSGPQRKESLAEIAARLVPIADAYFQKHLSSAYMYLLPPSCRPPWTRLDRLFYAMKHVHKSTLSHAGVLAHELDMAYRYWRDHEGDEAEILQIMQRLCRQLEKGTTRE